MNTTTARTALAIAACEGLSDAELSERGPAGFMKMRDRKRKYSMLAKAAAAVTMKQHTELLQAAKLIADLQHKLAVAEAKVAMTASIESDVDDVDTAAGLLAKFTNPAA